VPVPVTPAPAAPAQEAAAPAAAAAPAPPRRASHVLVRVLSDVAPFVGVDLRNYRLSREDVASVPKEIAHVLVTRGKAALVTMPPA
ncbi:MAG TPA: hypothetical protein VNZ52_06640, partial [Candidatus Thermoplasmatota archaeon]|nr:hypothetical protein [Candidatus Thermoplasmatota archaeon]